MADSSKQSESTEPAATKSLTDGELLTAVDKFLAENTLLTLEGKMEWCKTAALLVIARNSLPQNIQQVVTKVIDLPNNSSNDYTKAVGGAK